MDYYAHSFGDDGDRSKWQPLADHLIAVADLAERFARDALPGDDDFAHAARLAGLLHDLGKYRPEFQAMLAGAPKTANTRHKQAGAARAAQAGRADLAFAISGHHGGLPDRGALKDGIKGPGGNDLVAKCWDAALCDCEPIAFAPSAPPCFANVLAADVHIRLLFSCLVDADWQDTADFYDRAADESPAAAQAPLEAECSLSCVLAYIAERAKRCSDRRIAAIRDEVLRAALAAASALPGLFTMTVPTGGGKTLSALAFALAHAAKHRLRRIIYVAPYLSILEQNAREIRRALNVADDSPQVFEHHSLADLVDASEDEQDRAGSTRRRAEAWDAPVIITTNVQFFESLFASQARFEPFDRAPGWARFRLVGRLKKNQLARPRRAKSWFPHKGMHLTQFQSADAVIFNAPEKRILRHIDTPYNHGILFYACVRCTCKRKSGEPTL